MVKEYEQELLEHHGELTLECRIPPGVVMTVDRDKFKRVFDNLISNSVKYSKDHLKIMMICVQDGSNLKFSIEDTGAGVVPEEFTKIFDQFYRVDKSRSREQGGSGLGLAICRRIVEAHGGKIWAYAPEDGGLGISFVIPMQR